MKILYSIVTLLIFLSFASCNDDKQNNDTIVYGKIDVAVSVTLPEPKVVENTLRRSATFKDTDIKNVDVLVFDENNKFIERVKVEESDLESTPSGVNFTVPLSATPKKRIIHFVTNGRTADGADRLDFSSLKESELESVIIPSLKTLTLSNISSGENSVIDNIMPIVMWGRIEISDGISIATKVTDAKLLRSVAAISVKAGVASDTNGLNNFTLQNISVYKASDRGYVAPVNYTGIVAIPTEANALTEDTYIDYNKAWAYSGDSSPSIYVYERKSTVSDYMSVIIKATYKGDEGFYKVLITDADGNPLDIIRNHRYIMTIVGVNAKGYANIDTAINSAPSNALKIELLDDDADFSFIIADSQYSMGLTNNVYHLYGSQTSSLELCNVYSSRNIVPSLSLSNNPSWIKNLTVESLGNNRYKVLCDFQSEGSSDLSTTLTLQCDNLIQSLEITWSPTISSVFDLVQSGDQNWYVQILSSSLANFIGLHPTDATTSLPSASLFSELSSKYYSHAYLHINNVAEGKGIGVLKMSTVSGGKAIVRRINVAN